MSARKKKRSTLVLILEHIEIPNFSLTHSSIQADQVVQEVERNCEQRLEEMKEESRQSLIRIQEEHAALVTFEKKFTCLSLIKIFIVDMAHPIIFAKDAPPNNICHLFFVPIFFSSCARIATKTYILDYGCVHQIPFFPKLKY